MNYLARHMQSGIYSLGKLSRAPWSSLMTCLMIGITLALPAVLFVTLKNAEFMNRHFQNTLTMTLYLKHNVLPANVNAFLTQLKNRTDIQTIQAISPDDGLKELQKQAGFHATLDNLENNPLPWAIVIQPNKNVNTPAQFEKLTHELQQYSEVDTVQCDILWVKRFTSFMALAHRILYTLTIFLGLAALLIINNTIRSTTEQHHREIEVIQLIGGTHAFIRRPFLYVGMMYGLLGGILAWLLVCVMILALKTPSHTLATLYGSQFTLVGMNFFNLLILLASSISLGFMGSWVAVTKYLNTHTK